MHIVILVRAHDKRRREREEREGGDGDVDADNASGNDPLDLEEVESQNPENQDMNQSFTLLGDNQANSTANGITPVKDPQDSWDARNSLAVIPIVYEDEEVVHC